MVSIPRSEFWWFRQKVILLVYEAIEPFQFLGRNSGGLGCASIMHNIRQWMMFQFLGRNSGGLGFGRLSA